MTAIKNLETNLYSSLSKEESNKAKDAIKDILSSFGKKSWRQETCEIQEG